jgi:hypothetical protein
VRTREMLSRRRSECQLWRDESVAFSWLTLDSTQKRRDVVRDILQRAVQRLAQTAEEHKVEDIVHLTSKHGTDRSR